jgi:hypothetical protein
MSRSSFQACLEHTVQELEKAAVEDSTIQTYTVDSLRLAIEQAFFLRGGPITEFPPLFLCPNEERPQLDAGQHRREAFLNIVDRKRETTVLTPQNIEVRFNLCFHTVLEWNSNQTMIESWLGG